MYFKSKITKYSLNSLNNVHILFIVLKQIKKIYININNFFNVLKLFTDKTPEIVAARKKPKKVSEWMCPTCNQFFATEKGLLNHKKLHDIIHRCEVCLKIFGTKRDLARHMRTHTGEKPYACSTCGRRFSQKHNLKDHERLHSNERKFECKVCKKLFRTKTNLTYHMLTHNEPKFSCPHCIMKFLTSNQLKAHINTHIKNNFEPHWCTKCGKIFRSSANLKLHEKRNDCFSFDINSIKVVSIDNLK